MSSPHPEGRPAAGRLAVDELVFEKPEAEHLKGTYELYAINREKSGLRFVEPRNTFSLDAAEVSEPRAPAAPASSDQYKKLALEGRFEWLGEDERPAWLCGEFDVAEPEEPTDENDHVVYFLLHNKRRTSSMLGQMTEKLPKARRRLSVTRISFVPEIAQKLYDGRVEEGHLLIAFVPPTVAVDIERPELAEEAVELLARPCKSAYQTPEGEAEAKPTADADAIPSDGGPLAAQNGVAPTVSEAARSPAHKRSRTG